MLNKIVDGISAALLEAFPYVKKVYTVQVKQGLETPCFIISCVNPISEQIVGNRYHRSYLFSVQYTPHSSTDAKPECYKVLETLFQVLECIKVGDDLTRGTKMHAEFVDGALIFLVNYDMFVYKQVEIDPMEILSVENQAR